jgi:cytochrome c biogenesis factor
MSVLKNLSTHTIIIIAACTVIVLGVIYMMLLGLIHDGQTGISIAGWFQDIIKWLFSGSILTGALAQVLDYKNKSNQAQAQASVSRETAPIGSA